MFRSIRWTLQVWHAVLLLAVVCAFAATMYLRLRYAALHGVDTELASRAEVLAARLGPAPPWAGRERGPGRERPNGERPNREPPDGNRPSGDRPPMPPDRGRGAPPGGSLDAGRRDEFERHFEVPPDVQRRFATDEPGGWYFAVWRSNGQLLETSRPLPELPAPPARVPFAPPGPPVPRQRGALREVIVAGPFEMQVLVGKSIAAELAELRRLVIFLAATGAAVLVIGLAGGWWLSGRTVRPIDAITQTARGISASNLSARIDVKGTKSELGAMAGVLNDMFARLESAFERQTRFTADASHELRTPLSVIHSQTELALARERTGPEYRQALEICLRAARRMKSLVDSLLMLARADAGRLELHPEPFDLAGAVEDCVELVRPLGAARGIAVTADLAPAPVMGDPFRLAQVVTNLLTNAIHYNRDGGAVNVSLRADGPDVLLSVSDTGQGIPEGDQPHIFERFYRVDKARSRQIGGSGLGLAICRSIVAAHGGTIGFASRPGEGTTFTVRLPRAEPPAPAEPVKSPRKAEAAR